MALTCWLLDEAWCGIHYLPNPTITVQGNNAVINQSGIIAIGATAWTVVDGANNVVGSGTMLSSATTITICSAGSWVGGGTANPGHYTVYTNSGTNGVVVGTVCICTANSNLYVPNSSEDADYNLSAWLGSAPDRDYYSFIPPFARCGTGAVSTLQLIYGPAAGGSVTMQSNGMGSAVTVTIGETAATLQTALAAQVTGTTVTGGPFGTNDLTITWGTTQTSVTLDSSGITVGSTSSTPATILSTLAADEYFLGPQDAARPRYVWVSSGAQAVYPIQNPTTTQWAALATILLNAGYTGIYWELPSNEPDENGWSAAQIVTYWNACATAILAVDATAHVRGWCSGGVYALGGNAELSTFLAGVTSTLSAFTNHMENSHQNLSNIVMLRQYFGGLKTQLATSGVPNLDVHLTETGINEGVYGVLHPRRAARQRCVLRFVAESYGWAKEHSYDFPVWDHTGSGLTTYLVDVGGARPSGNLRAGTYALHVMGEALFGTTCNPTNIPAKLSFGPTGTLGDSLFAGLHYTATAHDVVVLATNGIESDSVTLNVSNPTGITAWDGWGNTRTVTVSGNHVTVAVDDLLTYVFLPPSSTVSVVDTGSNVLTKLNVAANIAALATSIVNEVPTSIIGVVANNSFAENNSGIPGVTAPYSDATVPGTVTASHFWNNASGQAIQGVAIMTAGPAWQTNGCSITGFQIIATIGGTPTTVYTYSCPSAVSYAIPSPSNSNNSDICTRTTWWTAPFAFIVPLNLSGVVTALEINITGTGYGGQPDLAASQVAENDPQAIALAEVQIYQGAVAGPGSPALARMGA